MLGYDRELCRDAVSAFAEELSRFLKRRARARLGMADALTRSICVVQRADGALRHNVQLHVLALDGAYTEDATGELSFHVLPTPRAVESLGPDDTKAGRTILRGFESLGMGRRQIGSLRPESYRWVAARKLFFSPGSMRHGFESGSETSYTGLAPSAG